MTLKQMPKAKFQRPKAYNWDAPIEAMEKWRPIAAEASGDVISIYGVIGADVSGDGITARRIAGALRSIGEKPVTVNVNSPGGDIFEGLAIYNLLREHPARVTVKVMGLAASAASIIAMAGDRVEMGEGSMLMIHNSWGLVMGNKQDFSEATKVFAEFDAALSDIYSARTGRAVDEISKMMNAETWMRAQSAIDLGFADSTFAAPEYDEKDDKSRALFAKARFDNALAKSGVSRSERREIWREAVGTQNASETATPSAGFDPDAVSRLIEMLKD